MPAGGLKEGPGGAETARVTSFLAAAILGFAVVGALVGGRLLRLSQRTGGAPERVIGIGLLTYATFCQPTLLVAGAFGESLTPAAIQALHAWMSATAALTVTCLYLFTWIVFRRESGWGRVLLAAGVGLAVVSETASVLERSIFWSTLSSANFVVAFVWAGAESLRYYVLLRRRARLGLADPVVQNRFGVWGVCMSVAAVLSATVSVCIAAGLNVGEHPFPTAVALANTCLNAAGWSLTFFPPAWYLRAVRRRAALGAAPNEGAA